MFMLHGWTGDENSMWFFARRLPDHYWLIAPRAPFSAAQSGFSWRPWNPSTTHPPAYEQMRPSAAMLFDLIERWGIANSADVSQVDMMGFSQGAAMTLTFALTYPGRIRKIGILAGFPPLESESLVKPNLLEGKAAFIAHGVTDELVNVEYARQSRIILEKAGAKVTFCEADVGHKVSAECLSALEEFFSR
jgi:phospholipase/carboxylesterase